MAFAAVSNRIMLSKLVVLFLVTSCLAVRAQDAPPWISEMNAGKAAFSAGKYAAAAQKYAEALAKAEISGADTKALLPILRAFATTLRTNNDPAGAQQIVERTIAILKETSASEPNLEVANALSELAVVQRAQDFRKEAIGSLQQAMILRRRSPLTEQVARDATLMATLWQEMGEFDRAAQHFEAALYIWGTLPDSGLLILTALDPLASIRRNQRLYERAEELYTWELRLQEASLGPKDAEIIATLDSLAYVLFGQKKYEAAEPVYNRLLALWELVGGHDHPMVALTLDKMVEFYLDQKRYDVAEPLVKRALTIRSKAEIETLHRNGRILTGQKKLEDALDLYSRALRIASDAHLPDEEIPGALEAYALLLRSAQRDKDATTIEKRLADARRANAQKDGQRTVPAPVPPKPQKPEEPTDFL
jgi:tetratricopeptide (TPR) repeat protein